MTESTIKGYPIWVEEEKREFGVGPEPLLLELELLVRDLGLALEFFKNIVRARVVIHSDQTSPGERAVVHLSTGSDLVTCKIALALFCPNDKLPNLPTTSFLTLLVLDHEKVFQRAVDSGLTAKVVKRDPESVWLELPELFCGWGLRLITYEWPLL